MSYIPAQVLQDLADHLKAHPRIPGPLTIDVGTHDARITCVPSDYTLWRDTATIVTPEETAVDGDMNLAKVRVRIGSTTIQIGTGNRHMSPHAFEALIGHHATNTLKAV